MTNPASTKPPKRRARRFFIALAWIVGLSVGTYYALTQGFIGRWIIETACRQTAEWQSRATHPLATSVNLSAKQLVHTHLCSQIREILDELSLDPRQLKLEVTESTVMENSERSLSVLRELAELGVSLSTDDFGTGYSSLSYLHRFPFNRLKIDRSFISKMEDDEKSAAIVKTILRLGENLGIEVVAEGIELHTDLAILRGWRGKDMQRHQSQRGDDIFQH